MAIDYGAKRVGIASTDEGGSFALPRAVWRNDETLIDKILEFKAREAIAEIIIGQSNDLAGKANPIQKQIEELKAALEERGARVLDHPEMLTTVEARRLQGSNKMTDASAAALILKSYLDKMYNEK